jgi:hypothetical protein
MQNPTDNFAQLEFSSHKSDVVTGYTREIKKESYFGRLSYDYNGSSCHCKSNIPPKACITGIYNYINIQW